MRPSGFAGKDPAGQRMLDMRVRLIFGERSKEEGLRELIPDISVLGRYLGGLNRLVRWELEIILSRLTWWKRYLMRMLPGQWD